MTVVEDLIRRPAEEFSKVDRGLDPFLNTELLQEVQLLDMRVHAVSTSVALLMDLRSSLQFDEGSAAVLIVRGVVDLQWRSVQRVTDMTAWSVMAFEVSVAAPREFGMCLSFFPDASLTIKGGAAEFFIIDVEGLDEVPPDYETDLGIARRGLPQWGQLCTVLGSTAV
jgi:hypothetical protein